MRNMGEYEIRYWLPTVFIAHTHTHTTRFTGYIYMCRKKCRPELVRLTSRVISFIFMISLFNDQVRSDSYAYLKWKQPKAIEDRAIDKMENLIEFIGNKSNLSFGILSAHTKNGSLANIHTITNLIDKLCTSFQTKPN